MEADDEAFQEEVLALFQLEAQEWLFHIKAALDELEKYPPPTVREKIVEILIRGLTNLGGSAATVSLPTIEQLAFQVLSELSALRAEGVPLSQGSWARLRAGVERMSDEVEQAGSALSVSSDHQEKPNKTIEDTRLHPEVLPVDQNVAFRDSQGPGESSGVAGRARRAFRPQYEALRAIVEIRHKILSTPRNVADPVLRRLEGVEAHSGQHAAGRELETILHDLDLLDEQFLAEFQEGVPRLLQAIARLKHSDAAVVLSEDSLKHVIHEIEGLQGSAGKVTASAIDSFLNGLLVFLNVVRNKTVSVAMHRLEAVEVRLANLIPTAEQWVEVGRVEREALRHNIQL